MSERESDHTKDHLSAETIDAFLDGALTSALRSTVQAHLTGCETCQSEVRDFRSLRMLLSSMPEPRPRRSFQLDTAAMASTTRWHRLLGALMPALPALRAATVVLVLLIGGVALADRNSGDNDASDQEPVVAIVAATSVDQPTVAQSTRQPLPVLVTVENDGSSSSEVNAIGQEGPDNALSVPPSTDDTANLAAGAGASEDSGESKQGAAFGGSAPDQSGRAGMSEADTASEEQADAGAADGFGGDQAAAPAEAAAVAPDPTEIKLSPAGAIPTAIAATPTSIPTPSVTPAATATAAAPISNSTDGSTNGWRLVESGLILLFCGLLALVILLQRARRPA